MRFVCDVLCVLLYSFYCSPRFVLCVLFDSVFWDYGTCALLWFKLVFASVLLLVSLS